MHIMSNVGPWRLCDISYLSETHLWPKSRENSFAQNVIRSCSIVLKFCTKRDSDAVVLGGKLQNDWIIEMHVMDERYFVRCGFNVHVSIGQIFYTAQPPGTQWSSLFCARGSDVPISANDEKQLCNLVILYPMLAMPYKPYKWPKAHFYAVSVLDLPFILNRLTQTILNKLVSVSN